MTHISTIESVRVDTSGLHLSGLHASPVRTTGREQSTRHSRGLIMALHGGGYSAGYWHCPTDGASLLELGACLGFHVLALDRPGYGASRACDSSRLTLSSQVELLFDAIETWTATNRFEGPKFIIGHSIGGILALLMAAHPRGKTLSGVDVLGVPIRFSHSEAGKEVRSWPGAQTHLPVLDEALRKSLLFGPPETFTAAADRYDRSLLRPMPTAEYLDAIAVPDAWERVLPSIRLPVQFSVAEFEAMQVTGWSVLEGVRTLLSSSPHVIMQLQIASGHNASMHRIARAYHLRAIGFFEECLALRILEAP